MPPDFSPQALLDSHTEVHEFQAAGARDSVLIAQFAGGGLISYKRANGTYLHTLNTVDGFDRKLMNLGITLPQKGVDK